MNGAELHLAINHLPVYSTLFGCAILLGGLIFKKTSVIHVGYFLLIIAGISAILAVNTGEEAEEIIEKIGNTSHDIIHEHEEMAESTQVISIVTGLFAILGLFLSYTKRGFARLVGYAVLMIAAIGTISMLRVAHSGGEIMHKEIRSDFVFEDIDEDFEEH